jgi:hypothetical protein
MRPSAARIATPAEIEITGCRRKILINSSIHHQPFLYVFCTSLTRLWIGERLCRDRWLA